MTQAKRRCVSMRARAAWAVARNQPQDQERAVQATTSEGHGKCLQQLLTHERARFASP